MQQPTPNQNIETCINTRQIAVDVVNKVLKNFHDVSEVDLRDKLQKALAAQPELLPEGWYDPPPAGIGILFENPGDNRSKYTTFREAPYWPKSKYKLSDETVGMVYMSPVDKATGIIGDLGFSFYRGNNQKIRAHMRKVLETLETIVEYTGVGVEFREISRFAGDAYKKAGLVPCVVTQKEAVGVNVGHSVPWSYEHQTAKEIVVLKSGSLDEIQKMIQQKRIFVDEAEEFEIPKTAAFTIETRAIDANDQAMPNIHFHFIVTFTNGQKRVLGGFNPIFDTLEMDYIRSRF